ncbi:IS30 family transposase [Actinoplanes sp. CA-142083]|uniref:IS30 family transposase n=1 Tax=Actinoplanes sp. CA-142083 TaxID=3239903 RepID=UPI003D8D1723
MEQVVRDGSVDYAGRSLLRREAYLALVDQGMGFRRAARIVGVSYRLTKRWRNGPKPIRSAAERSVRGRYLNADERIHIADRRREQASVRQIAAELGRDPSTVSRELRRNAHPDSGSYRPYAAQRRAEARRPRPKPRKIDASPQLRALIQDGLDLRWSPEQIVRRLRRDHPDRPELSVCPETIYQALYLQGRGGLRREVAAALRTGRVMRRPHRSAGQRTPRMATDMIMISERPAEIEDRAVPGHWEGDLIIGKGNKSAIGTLVERHTRYLMLVHLPDGRRTPDVFRDALITTITTLPAHLRRSLTWDQGSEMHLHHQFSLATDMSVYFCDPHSPWQRGTNENTNGLLRQYFPKSTDLAVHSREHLDAVAVQLNGRPRKTLGWDTPAERFAKLLTQAN